MLESDIIVGLAGSQERSKISLGDFEIGGAEFVVIAGPCAVETREQVMETAAAVRSAGARILRGGAFKPRTSPYDFQGLREDGLKLLADARELTGLKIVTETVTAEDVEMVSDYADILQVGARNMQNFELLKRLGRVNRPILLKRGMSATIREFLLAAEYIASSGNDRIVLCERGIRTFETSTRNTLDIMAVPVLQTLSHLPVIVDPSHSTGRRDLIRAASKAAVVTGADGIMVEVHPRPHQALCDGQQSITTGEFAEMMIELRDYVSLESRYMKSAPALV
jgi:3-deoxy-7-phosphoheptulonate synthase